MHFSRSRNVNLRWCVHASRHPHTWLLLALALLGLGASATATAASNPGYDRPGYGFTPVVLSAGDIIIEQGLPDWNRDRQDGISSSQFSADSLLRVGLGGPLELQFGTSLYNLLQQTSASAAITRHGHGDSHLALKLALPSSNQGFSWGLLGSVEWTDGAKDFRDDHRQYLLGAQVNLEVNAEQSLGTYLENIRSNGKDSMTLALSDNFTVTPSLTIYAEAVAVHLANRGNGTLAGTGLAWMLNSRTQLDAGFDRRLSGAATPWQANLGVSVYFGR
ncbi:MAG: transporter [Rhodanobacter sp.]